MNTTPYTCGILYSWSPMSFQTISLSKLFSRHKGEGHLRLWWARPGAPTGGPGHPEKLQGAGDKGPTSVARPLGSCSATGDGLHLLRRLLSSPEPTGRSPNLPGSPASMRPQPRTSLAFLPQEHAWLWGSTAFREAPVMAAQAKYKLEGICILK